MPDVLRVTDETSRAELAEIHEARIRRLMAERAALPVTWETRARRAELDAEIDAGFDEHAKAKRCD